MNDFNNDFYPPQPPKKEIDLKKAKSIFSAVGFSLCIIIAAAVIFQSLLDVIFSKNYLPFIPEYLEKWLMTFVPMYCIAIPLGIMYMKKLPKHPPEKQNISVSKFLMYFCITVLFVNIGSYIGNFLSLMMSQGNAENALNEYAFEMSIVKVIMMVVLAPIVEEFLFRKQIIDHTVIYGERTAVLLSGLFFGLFHTNMFQFFYAFFVGMLFGYVYVRTGKLRYPIILHGIVNLFGSVIAPFIMSKIDFEIVEKISKMDPLTTETEQLMEMIKPILPGLLMLLVYNGIWSILAIAGLIIYIINKRKTQWKETELELSRDEAATTVYMNPGTVVYILITAALTIASVYLL